MPSGYCRGKWRRDYHECTGGLTFLHALAIRAFGMNSASVRYVPFAPFVRRVPAVSCIAKSVSFLEVVSFGAPWKPWKQGDCKHKQDARLSAPLLLDLDEGLENLHPHPAVINDLTIRWRD